MTKHVKITLSGARDIPFSALVLSQANVRRVKAGVSIDSLAADIERRGLLQSLTVRAQRDEDGQETGKFEVPAGGRRFRALQQLVKTRRMAKTEPVPCIVRDDDIVSAEEDSLAENVHREPLHPLDQFRAMQKLVEQGSDIESIAATFMVTPAVVKQRLKLAGVSPKLHDIYAEDGMTLEQLIAFAVASDQALFRACQLPDAPAGDGSNITAHQLLRLLYADRRDAMLPVVANLAAHVINRPGREHGGRPVESGLGAAAEPHCRVGPDAPRCADLFASRRRDRIGVGWRQ